MSKQAVRILLLLDEKKQKLDQVYTDFRATKDEKAKKTKRHSLVVAVQDYCEIVTQGIAQNAIAADPYGVVNKIGCDLFMSNLVDDALENLRKKNPNVVTEVDATLIKDAQDRQVESSGFFKNGVKWLFDPETGKLVLMYRTVRRCIYMGIQKVKDFFTWLKNAIKSVFSSKEEDPGVIAEPVAA